jgi:hypothetical protein
MCPVHSPAATETDARAAVGTTFQTPHQKSQFCNTRNFLIFISPRANAITMLPPFPQDKIGPKTNKFSTPTKTTCKNFAHTLKSPHFPAAKVSIKMLSW